MLNPTSTTSDKAATVVQVRESLVLIQVDEQAAIKKNEVGYVCVGDERLKAEVLRIRGRTADMQVFEDTNGVRVGDRVEMTDEMLSATLGPGLLGRVFDGLQNPLHELADRYGFFLPRGVAVPPLDTERRWPLPLAIPGCPQPLRLGLAGGPLIVAILVSRVGRIGPLVWNMPLNANLAFREFGISLFFASVGLMAGPQFFAVVFSTRGAIWLASGICVTMLPLLLMGWLALVIWKMNFVVVAGVIAGSMTDPPALAFATNVCGAETPMLAYAAVYPLTTLTRILAVQILAVVLCG